MSLPPILGIVGIRINVILGAKLDGKSETLRPFDPILNLKQSLFPGAAE